MYVVCYLGAMALAVVFLVLFDGRRQGLALFFASLVFGLIGFCMVPRPDVYVDTIRFFDTLDTTRTMTLWDPQQGWSYLMNDSGYNAVPVMGLIMYLLSLQPQNGWLTFIAAAVDVGAGFVILWGTAKRHGRVSLIVGVLAFLALFNFNAAVSGVRNYMAGALAIVICYLTSQKKLWYAALFFPLILIHPFVLIIVVIYFLSTTIKRHRFIFSIACVVLFLQRMLQDVIFALFERMSFIPFFASLSFKSKQYFGEESYLVLSSVFSYLRSILLFSLFSFIIVVDMRKRALTRYDGICIMLLCLDAGAILDQELFSRVTGVLLFAALPMLYRLLSSGVQQLRHGRIDACFSVVVIGVIIVFVDNLRAGVSFQNIEANLYSIVLCVIIFVFTILSYVLSDALERREL